MRPLQNGTLCPISASGSNFNPRSASGGPMVEIFAFLELEQISADFENYHFSKVSINDSYFFLIFSGLDSSRKTPAASASWATVSSLAAALAALRDILSA